VVGATERLCPPFPLQAEPRLVPTASGVAIPVAITVTITSAIIIAVTIAATFVIAVASTTIVTLVFRTIVATAPATPTSIVIVGVGIVAAATTTTSTTLSIVIIVSDARLVVIDRAVSATFQPVRANIVVAAQNARLAVVDRAIAATLEAVRANIVVGVRHARLAVVDRTIAAMLEAVRSDVVVVVWHARLAVVDRTIAATLEAVCADVVVAVRHARLAVVDRTIAATLEAIRADVVIRHRAGECGICRSCLGSRALCRNRPGDNAGRCGKSQTFHWKFPIRVQFPTVRLRCSAGIILAASTILIFSHQARAPPRMATRKHKFHVDSALATAMDNRRKLVSVEPPEIASAQGHRAFSDPHPAARRSLTHEVVKSQKVAGRSSFDQRMQALASRQIDHCRANQIAVIYRGESFNEIASTPGKPFARFPVGLPWRPRSEPSDAADIATRSN
jgi:hypothetical protein